MAQGGAQVRAEHAEEDQRRQELDQQEECEVGQTQPELQRQKLFPPLTINHSPALTSTPEASMMAPSVLVPWMPRRTML